MLKGTVALEDVIVPFAIKKSKKVWLYENERKNLRWFYVYLKCCIVYTFKLLWRCKWKCWTKKEKKVSMSNLKSTKRRPKQNMNIEKLNKEHWKGTYLPISYTSNYYYDI